MLTAPPPPLRPQRHVVWLTLLLVVLAFSLRLAFLIIVQRHAGFDFSDPDHYMSNGARLVSAEGFRWTFEAVYYPWGGRVYTLPPLYPFVLGLVAAFPGYPLTAAIGQILISSLTVVTLVALGVRLHSTRAGLIAGFLHAIWGSSIIGTGSFMQERLYVPLIALAFLVLVDAYAHEGSKRPWRFLAAGVALGLAALCRSMPMYFTGGLALAHVALAQDRRAALREAGALVAGFALLTVPYSIALSVHLGHPTFIEDHGGILVAHRFGAPNNTPPGLATVAGTLASELLKNPGEFTSGALDGARSMFHVNGGRFLEQGVNASTRAVADAWKVFAHLSIDLPYVLVALLAAPGVVLARNRIAGVLFAGWILLNVALVAMTGFGGARLRAPFEPHLIVLAGVVLAGGWRRASRAEWSGALSAAAVAAVAVLPQIPRSLRAHGNYGVDWTLPEPPHVATIRERGGFNMLLAPGGLLSLRFYNPSETTEWVRVGIEGATVADLQLMPGTAREFRAVRPNRTSAYVEIEGAQTGLVVDVPRR